MTSFDRGNEASAVPLPSTDKPTGVLVTRIEARPTWSRAELEELWRYRSLLAVLARRDLVVRYRQAAVGAAWAILQPVVTMILFTALFRLLGRYPADSSTPYAVSLYCGLLPWQLFASTVRDGGLSLVGNQALITKVYFPRVLVPVGPALTALVDFALAFVVLLALMAWYDLPFTATLALLPLVLLGILAVGLSIAIGVSAITALYRDLQFVIPFLLQVGFLMSPVLYETTSIVPESWRWLYALNPMAVALDSFRWCVLGQAPPSLLAVGVAGVVTAALAAASLSGFRRLERVFADRI